MTQTIHIREFREEDLEAVHKLVTRVVDTCYTGVYPAGALAMYMDYHNRDNILNDARAGYCVVAERELEIVGTGALIEDWVQRVYIHPDFQKLGIGRMIYGMLEKHALDNGIPHLKLGSSVIAREFWETLGFIFEGEHIVPAPNGEKLLFFSMSKQLPVNK